jgi:hypothetical protein
LFVNSKSGQYVTWKHRLPSDDGCGIWQIIRILDVENRQGWENNIKMGIK